MWNSTQSQTAVEILRKFKDNKEPIQLLKSESYYCNISSPYSKLQLDFNEVEDFIKIENRYFEVTQDSTGRYHLYEMAEEEVIRYFNLTEFDGMGLIEGGPLVGEPCKILKSEDLKER